MEKMKMEDQVDRGSGGQAAWRSKVKTLGKGIAALLGGWTVGVSPVFYRLVWLLLPLLLLVSASQPAAARKCEGACATCEKSCASQRYDCRTHARAERVSRLGECTPGHAGKACRRLARQAFVTARSE